jgi:4'-phosphopantetheinyl transferase EntD
MRKLFLAGVMFGGLLTAGCVFAADEQAQQDGVDVDQVIATCEDKYATASVSDDNERNRLIDQCIDSQLNPDKTQTEQ